MQFDVESKDANGQTVREFSIDAANAKAGTNILVKVSLWPEWAHVKVEKGDFVAVNGKFTASVGDTKTFYNITAGKLVVVPGSAKQEREVVNRPSQDDGDDIPF